MHTCLEQFQDSEAEQLSQLPYILTNEEYAGLCGQVATGCYGAVQQISLGLPS